MTGAIVVAANWLTAPLSNWLLPVIWVVSGSIWAVFAATSGRPHPLRPRADTAHLRQDGTGYIGGWGHSDLALVAPFKNAASMCRWHFSPDEEITAQIDFMNSDGLAQRSIAGCWVGARTPSVKIPAGQVRELLIAVTGDKGGFGVPQASPVSATEVAEIADILDTHRKGAYTRLLGLANGEYTIRVTLSGTSVRFTNDYVIELHGKDSWIDHRSRIREVWGRMLK